jgi:hypothetical protein
VLQPGTRIIWGGGAASIPGERSQLELDYNGIWLNKRTGERYSQFETPGAAGAGYVVADVLIAEPTGFLLWLSQLQIHPEAGGVTSFTDSDGVLAGAQNIHDFWVAPAQLARLADRITADSRVLHMPYLLDGESYRAVRIQNKTGGDWSQHTYHLDSGLCLTASSTVQGKPVLIFGLSRTLETGAGSTQVSYLRIVGIRKTALPGPGEAYPRSVRRLRRMSYSGTSSVMVGSAGVRPQTFPIRIDYNIGANAGDYLTARRRVSGVPEPRDRVIPAGVVGSLWMNPETLARFRPGQTLDHDPIIGLRTQFVSRLGRLAAVENQTALAHYSFGYDADNGLLTRAVLRTQTGITTKIVTVQLTGTQ